jgi:hypothetical protein
MKAPENRTVKSASSVVYKTNTEQDAALDGNTAALHHRQ